MLACLCGMALFICFDANAQVRPPGYEREVEQMKKQDQLSPMDIDSVIIIDTLLIFDPETGREREDIVKSHYSMRDYCINVLGIDNPEQLLDGQPRTITNPVTYEDMIVKWNRNTRKLDTIPPEE